MAEVWELIKQAIQRFYEVALAWLEGLNLDPREWDDTTRLVVLGAVLLVVLVLTLRRRGGRSARRAGWPEFLVTNGSVHLLTDASDTAERARPQAAAPYVAGTARFAANAAPADGGTRKPALLSAPRDARYQLRMTVNNLNAYAVQLLELSVQTSGSKQPVIADAAAVLPPHGAVDVVVDLYDLPGEHGTVALYLHSTAARPRSLRLVAPLEWEPWNQRYRVKGTGLRVEQSRAPASETYRRRRLGQLRRQRAGAAVVATGSSLVSGVTGAVRQWQERRAKAAAAAAAAREARSGAAARETPITVPLAPSRSTRHDGGGSEAYRERVAWPDEPRDEAERPAPREQPATPADDDAARVRPRLDFPDEF